MTAAPSPAQLQPIALQIQQGRQRLGRLGAGDHVVVAEHADRHAGDAQARRLARARRRPAPPPASRAAAAILGGRARAPRRSATSTAARRYWRRSTKKARNRAAAASIWRPRAGRRQHQRMGRHRVGLGADGAEGERDALARRRPATTRRCTPCAWATLPNWRSRYCARVTPRGGRCGLSRNGCQTTAAPASGQHALQADEGDVAPGADQVGDEADHRPARRPGVRSARRRAPPHACDRVRASRRSCAASAAAGSGRPQMRGVANSMLLPAGSRT